jgi:hypothetical protein
MSCVAAASIGISCRLFHGNSGQIAVLVIGNASQDISNPGLRIKVMELGGLDQGVHDGGSLPAAV